MSEMSAREILHAQISRKAATQGMVLLKNDGAILPLEKGTKVAVFGIGQVMTVKGGTGSGEVNNRYNVNILEGLRNDPDLQVDESIAPLYEAWAEAHPVSRSFFHEDTGPAPELPLAQLDLSALSAHNDAAILVISRIAGEGADWKGVKEDYYLTDEEAELIEKVSAAFPKTVLLLNTSGVMDTSYITDAVGAVLYTSLPGQESGNAIADVLTGKVNPSGRLTDSWPIRYEDCPSAGNFGIGERNGNVQKNRRGGQIIERDQARVIYTEGIMVGYRYYDSFDVPVAYPFGFGLSYTTFATKNAAFALNGNTVTVTAQVENTGAVAGREVLQLYVGQPEGRVPKAKKVLAAFAKTEDIAPGATVDVKLSFPMEQVASYEEETACYVLEAGAYTLHLGTDVTKTGLIGAVSVAADITTKNLVNLFAGGSVEKPLPLVAPAANFALEGVPTVALDPGAVVAELVSYQAPEYCFTAVEGATLQQVKDGKITLEELVGSLCDDELTELVTGVGMYFGELPPPPPEGFKKENKDEAPGEFTDISLGRAKRQMFVPGAAGESVTNQVRGFRPMSLCDGPAGVRIQREVKENGEVVREQNCTAWPVGTLLASTWDEALLEEVGGRIGDEMMEYKVDLWLAPGMNIHRNPLCGRNFEYYSEDPLITGKMAAAISRGVQSRGVGVTIKHFAGNNQEDMRNCCEDIISEQALREIYLRGFEIAVKEAKPLSLMTSYNDINGVPSADNFDLCTQALRREWGFDGFVMTDWGGGISTPAISMGAGNDMIQPGGDAMLKLLRDHFAAGKPVVSHGTARVTRTLTRYELQVACRNILSVLLRLPDFQ